MQFLKQSTSVKVPVGSCVDATDGFTLEGSISWATGEAALIKQDGTAIVNIGTNTWSAHLGGGFYNVTLSASDTDTLGLLTLVAYDTACRPVVQRYMVVPAQVYNSLVLGTDLLDANASQFDGNAAAGFLTNTTTFRGDVVRLNGDATAAANQAAAALGISTGTVQTGSTTTNIKTNLTETQNDHYNGRVIIFLTGTQALVAAAITDYSGASKDLTVSALPAAPSNGDTFVIV